MKKVILLAALAFCAGYANSQVIPIDNLLKPLYITSDIDINWDIVPDGNGNLLMCQSSIDTANTILKNRFALYDSNTLLLSDSLVFSVDTSKLNIVISMDKNASGQFNLFMLRRNFGNYIMSFGTKVLDIQNNWQQLDSTQFQYGNKLFTFRKAILNKSGNYLLPWAYSESPATYDNVKPMLAELTPKGVLKHEVQLPNTWYKLGAIVQLLDSTYAISGENKIRLFNNSFELTKTISIEGNSYEFCQPIPKAVLSNDSFKTYWGYTCEVLTFDPLGNVTMPSSDRLVALKNGQTQTVALIPLDFDESFHSNLELETIAKDENGNIYFGNTYFSSNLQWNTIMTVHKVDSSGNILWSKYFGSKDALRQKQYLVLPNGDLLITVYKEITSNNQLKDVDVYYLRIKPDGTVLTMDLPNELDSNLSVYPNPVNDQLHLSYAGFQPETSVLIFNLFGQKVIEQQTISNEAIPTQNLSSGIYFVQVLNKGKVLGFTKFIKN